MTSENLFPIPNSGRVQITRKGRMEFDVECSQVNSADRERLEGFFNRMYGRLIEFRFDYTDVVYPKCRFDSDSVTFFLNRLGEFNVTLPVKVLF